MAERKLTQAVVVPVGRYREAIFTGRGKVTLIDGNHVALRLTEREMTSLIESWTEYRREAAPEVESSP